MCLWFVMQQTSLYTNFANNATSDNWVLPIIWCPPVGRRRRGQRAHVSYECLIWSIIFSGRYIAKNVWTWLYGSSIVGSGILSNNMRPLSRMLHDVPEDGNIQWHRAMIRRYTNFWAWFWSGPYYRHWLFYPFARGFHRTFATGAACQQRTPTPPDTWSCPTLELACVLMLRRIFPALVFRIFEFRTSLGTNPLAWRLWSSSYQKSLY